MPRPVSEITADIENFKPSNGNWLVLDALLQELFLSGSASVGIDAMLHVFERYPAEDEDGAGVFWSIVHGLESLPGYENGLVESVRREPSCFALLMVNRLLNAECADVGGTSLRSLLEQVAQDETARPEIRQEAQLILDRHNP
jgi:hypothetical protein